MEVSLCHKKFRIILFGGWQTMAYFSIGDKLRTDLYIFKGLYK